MKGTELKDYIAELSGRVAAEGPESFFSERENLALQWLVRQTHVRTNHAKMLVGPSEGALLRLFVEETFRGVRDPEILEIGTFTGYSLVCLASGAKAAAGGKAEGGKAAGKCGGKVTALEINDELGYLIDEAVARAGIRECADVVYGDAKSLLGSMEQEERFDMVFIDANKREYTEYYRLALPLLKTGGYILADNVLWHGKVAAAESGGLQARDPQTKGIIAFDRLVMEETEKGAVESTLLDIRDGLYVIRKIR